MRRSSWRGWAFVLVALALHTLLLFGYRHLEHLAYHDGEPAILPLLCEITGAVAAIPLAFPFLAVVRRFPLGRATWAKHLPVHVALLVALSVAHTSMMGWSRALLFPALGLGEYDYGDVRVRYAMELANDAVTYAIILMLLMGYEALRAAREREIAQADLRAELARAEVRSLERRLHPHFLFNALNTISQVMYDDPAAAERMIAGLSDLLRRALKTGDAQEVPLAQEIELLEHYLEIMRARFEERLSVAVEIDDDAKGALVPPLLLQPLVENAIRHGADPASHRVRAALRARRLGGALRLEVRDHGRGLSGAKPKEGVGLSTTIKRLSTLYGDAQKIAFEDADGGGLRVTIELPFRTAHEEA